MMNKAGFHIALFALVVTGVHAGPQVYKSTDAEGNVTYSANPPAAQSAVVEEVPIAEPPSEDRQREASRRARDVERQVERSELERQKKAKERNTTAETAEKALEEARAALEQAKIKTLDDWQTIAAGGRVVKQSYFDRVERAEAKVKAAEDALKKAGRKR